MHIDENSKKDEPIFFE